MLSRKGISSLTASFRHQHWLGEESGKRRSGFTSLKICLYFKDTLFEVERILEIVILDNKRRKFSLGKYIPSVVPLGVVLLGPKRNVCSPDSTYITSHLHLKVPDISLNVFSYSQVSI